MRKKALIVARWPLGGIRTYMRFVYEFLREFYDITILAVGTQEIDALRADAKAIGVELIVSWRKADLFFLDVRNLLKKRDFDIIQSQGFISAFHVSLGNRAFKIPHILTVHGVLEERLMTGVLGSIKKQLVKRALLSADAIYAVSNDILEHLLEQVPAIRSKDIKQKVILNGINPRLFADDTNDENSFRGRVGLDENVFAIGFLGRLMPQKGFPCLVNALVHIEGMGGHKEYVVLVVGSGDYRDWYVRMVEDHGLSDRIVFVPFQQDMNAVYRGVDLVVMPSVWEACPLQPMEALCCGVPVLASDCIGLREVVRDTPARTFPQGDSNALALVLYDMIEFPDRNPFWDYREEALYRFDARQTATQVKEFFNEICN